MCFLGFHSRVSTAKKISTMYLALDLQNESWHRFGFFEKEHNQAILSANDELQNIPRCIILPLDRVLPVFITFLSLFLQFVPVKSIGGRGGACYSNLKKLKDVRANCLCASLLRT